MKKFMAGTLVFAISFASGFALAQSRKMAAQMIQKDLLESKQRLETRPLMDPNLFSRDGYIEQAYRIAGEIPDVLDKLFCYCYCAINPNFKHKSLLTCYTDTHAAQCGVCLREAHVAKRMTDEGKSPEEVATYLRDYYLNRQ